MVWNIPCHSKMKEWGHCEEVLDQIKTLALQSTTHLYVVGWVCSLYWVSLADFPQPWHLCYRVVSNTVHALLPPLHTVASQGFSTVTPMPHTTHCLASALLETVEEDSTVPLSLTSKALTVWMTLLSWLPAQDGPCSRAAFAADLFAVAFYGHKSPYASCFHQLDHCVVLLSGHPSLYSLYFNWGSP